LVSPVARSPIDEIFIFPAMGDDGMPAGGALCYLPQHDGLSHWLSQRHRRDYTNLVDDAMAACADTRRTVESPVESAARKRPIIVKKRRCSFQSLSWKCSSPSEISTVAG
jgi:predicted NodU family carbamoyl transferase